MYDADIIVEYNEVLHREKFLIRPDVVDDALMCFHTAMSENASW